MAKKLLIAGGAVVLVGSLGLFLWARSVLTGDTVRLAVAGQLSKALGQPVTIGSLGATIFPRVTMTLGDVAIGQPARITAKELYVGTDFRALLSRRIEHAVVRLTGSRVQLPLPPLGGASAGPTDTSSAPPVQIVSVDEISLSDAEIVSGSRTVRGDITLAVQGQAVEIERATFGAGNATFHLTGHITDIAGPAGSLSIDAGDLDFVQLLAFASDFSGSAAVGGTAAGASAATSSATPAKPASPMNVSLSLAVHRASFGALVFDKLSGTATLTNTSLQMNPIRFGVFGGTYDGTAAFTLGETPQFHLKASLAAIDVAKVMDFAGQKGAMTGTMTGSIDVSGRGVSSASVLNSTRGDARIAVANGTVKGLGLVRGIVLATSMRKDSQSNLSQTNATESFSELDGTFAVADGVATSKDLRFESTDVVVAAVAAVRLDGTSVDVRGPVQLSDALTQQAGRDFVKYTQKDGRVTLPATVTGPVDHLQVRIDVGDVAKRAITNAASDQLMKLLGKKTGRGGSR